MAERDSKLVVAIVGGVFALAGIFLTWYLDSEEPQEDLNAAAEARVLDEKLRREDLTARCIRTARGRPEAAQLASALLDAVKRGAVGVSGGGEGDLICKSSDFVRWENLDTGFRGDFHWIEDTEMPGAKVICTCST